jgi:hypothetical protein
MYPYGAMRDGVMGARDPVAVSAGRGLGRT